MKEQVHGGDVYRYPDVIDFSSNMNPLGTPDSLKQAVIASMERISQYPDVRCERLTEALAAYERVEKEMLICGNGAADLIFSLVQALKPKKALLQAGLDSTQYSAHKLRHTAATMMLSGGVDVKTVQEVLGHENLNTTQIYTHIESTELKIAAEANPLSKLDFSNKMEDNNGSNQ